MTRRSIFVPLAAADAATLLLGFPGTDLVHRLRHPRAWLERVGTDAAAAQLASAALWLAAVWLGAGLAAALLAARPGRVGGVARRLAGHLLPRALYRLVVTGVGVGVGIGLLAGPASAAAGPAPPVLAAAGPAPPVLAAAGPAPPVLAAAGPAPPVLAATAGTGGATPPAPLPAPAWPSDDPSDDASDGTTERGTDRGADAAAGAAPRHEAGAAGTARVVVRAGDSLWRIAAAHLPGRPTAARVAASWPRWYTANRSVVGADPDRIEPGQVLRAPAVGQPPGQHGGAP